MRDIKKTIEFDNTFNVVKAKDIIDFEQEFFKLENIVYGIKYSLYCDNKSYGSKVCYFTDNEFNIFLRNKN